MSLYLREHLTYDQARVQILHEGDQGKDLYMKGICIQGGIKNANQRIYPVNEIGKAVKTLNVGALIITNTSMPNNLAYGIVKAVWHPNVKPLFVSGHLRGEYMDRNKALNGIGFKIHPGAINYYKEVGVLSDPNIEDDLYLSPMKKIP